MAGCMVPQGSRDLTAPLHRFTLLGTYVQFHGLGTLRESSETWWPKLLNESGQASVSCTSCKWDIIPSWAHRDPIAASGWEPGSCLCQLVTLYSGQCCRGRHRGVVIGSPVQSSRPTKWTPRQMPRRQGREAHDPYELPHHATRSKLLPTRPDIQTSSQHSTAATEEAHGRRDMGSPSPRRAYVSMMSPLSPRGNTRVGW